MTAKFLVKVRAINMSEKLVLSVSELASELGISSPVAYELVRQKGFPAVRLSERRIVVPVDGLKRWLNEKAGA